MCIPYSIKGTVVFPKASNLQHQWLTVVFPTTSIAYRCIPYRIKVVFPIASQTHMYSLQYQWLTFEFPTASKLYSLQHQIHSCISYRTSNDTQLCSMWNTSSVYLDGLVLHLQSHFQKSIISITDSQLYYRYLKIDSTVVVFLWLSQIP